MERQFEENLFPEDHFEDVYKTFESTRDEVKRVRLIGQMLSMANTPDQLRILQNSVNPSTPIKGIIDRRLAALEAEEGIPSERKDIN